MCAQYADAMFVRVVSRVQSQTQKPQFNDAIFGMYICYYDVLCTYYMEFHMYACQP